MADYTAGGVIGSRAALRMRCPKGRAGSSPALPTKFLGRGVMVALGALNPSDDVRAVTAQYPFVAELVDALGSNPCAERRGSSTLPEGTTSMHS